MNRSGFGIALLVAFGCLSDGADAQKVKTTPVLGTFRCAEPGGLSGCATGDRIRGDGNVSPYPAQLGSSGAFTLAVPADDHVVLRDATAEPHIGVRAPLNS